jgi:hypothetical protein
VLLVSYQNPEKFSNKKIIIMKRKTLLPLLFFILLTNTAFAQITSQKIDSLMEDALAKFKWLEQQ